MRNATAGRRCRFRVLIRVSNFYNVAIRNIGVRRRAMRARVRRVRDEMRFGVGVDDKRSALRVARSRSRMVPNASSSRTMALNKFG